MRTLTLGVHVLQWSVPPPSVPPVTLATVDWSNSFSIRGGIVVRLVAAAVLGSIVGFEREADGQEAGFRTHTAVALGAGLFGIISTVGFLGINTPRALTNIQADVTRVASQVVVGISFLGAGLIFRQGGTIKNLTTAASLWVTAGIGLAAGVGDVGTAASATLVLMVVLAVLRYPGTWVHSRFVNDVRRLEVTLAPATATDPFEAAFRDADGLTVKRLVIGKSEGRPNLRVTVATARHHDVDDVVRWLLGQDDVIGVEETTGG